MLPITLVDGVLVGQQHKRLLGKYHQELLPLAQQQKRVVDAAGPAIEAGVDAAGPAIEAGVDAGPAIEAGLTSLGSGSTWSALGSSALSGLGGVFTASLGISTGKGAAAVAGSIIAGGVIGGVLELFLVCVGLHMMIMLVPNNLMNQK